MVDPTSRFAETYVREFPYGQSLPQIFLVEGVGQCAVKFLQNPQGPRVLINELVSFGVASALGIEHPRVGIAEVDAIVLPSDGVLNTFDRWGDPCMLEPGLHFYSQWLEPADRIEADDLKSSTVKNASMLAGVVLLDLLVNNWDRKRGNMNLLLHRESGGQRLKLIDMGMAFGGSLWTIGNLTDSSLPPVEEPLRYADELGDILAGINVQEAFDPYLRRLEILTRTRLQDIVQAVPDAWRITEEEREALLNYLFQRVQALPDYLSSRLGKDVWWQ